MNLINALPATSLSYQCEVRWPIEWVATTHHHSFSHFDSFTVCSIDFNNLSNHVAWSLYLSWYHSWRRGLLLYIDFIKSKDNIAQQSGIIRWTWWNYVRKIYIAWRLFPFQDVYPVPRRQMQIVRGKVHKVWVYRRKSDYYYEHWLPLIFRRDMKKWKVAQQKMAWQGIGDRHIGGHTAYVPETIQFLPGPGPRGVGFDLKRRSEFTRLIWGWISFSCPLLQLWIYKCFCRNASIT